VLRFFKLNDPYRLLAVLLIMAGLSIPVLIGPGHMTPLELKDIVVGESLRSGKMMYLQLIDTTPWLAAWFDKWISFFLGRSLTARHIVALLLLFFQASYFAVVLIRNRVYNEGTYLPALVYALLTFFSFDMLSLSQELFASVFLLFALNNLFKEIAFKVQREETIFNLGLYLGIASLFVLSYFIFLPGAVLLLLVYARLAFRRALLLIVGFLFPHLALLVYYYFYDGASQLFYYYYAQNLLGVSTGFISVKSVGVLMAPILFFLVASLVMLNREARFTRYQSQLLQAMFIWMGFALAEVGLTRNFTPHSLIPFIPPLAFLISHYFLLIRQKRIAETMWWVLLLSVIGFSTAARLNKLSSVNYSAMLVPESTDHQLQQKKVMVLANGWGVYQNNRAATYFLDWPLSEVFFHEPNIFQHVVLINESFEHEKPEVVIDEQNLMEGVFNVNPSLRKLYEKKGNLYWRKPVSKIN